jgi:DUF4097 and DUF4098 domain-containing protein YvlB
MTVSSRSGVALGVRGFAMLAGAFACLGVTVLARAEEINKRMPANPQGQVEVSNTSGSVTISGWDRNEVEVSGELGEGSERLEFTQSGDLTRIKVVLPGKGRHEVDDSDLVVRVPAKSSIAVNTVSADIVVQNVAGTQRLQSVSADVTTEAGTEDVECKTVSGDIAVVGSGRPTLLTITTISGDVRVQRVGGEINANTVSGNVDLNLGDTSRSRLRSTSGDLNLYGKLVGEARLDVESISGDVRIKLSQPIGAEFDLSSFNGDISNCFGPKAERTDQYVPGRQLRFKEGNGTGRVRVKTLNGDINLCRQ